MDLVGIGIVSVVGFLVIGILRRLGLRPARGGEETRAGTGSR